LTKYLNSVFPHLIGFILILFLLPVALTTELISLRPAAQVGASVRVDESSHPGVAETQTPDSNPYLTLAQNASDTLAQITETDTFRNQMVTRLELSTVWQSGQLWMDTVGTWVTILRINLTGGTR
jgi:hypothetical protein